MYKRLELHNHTDESDGSLTCQQLLDWMAADQVDGFALTDHNTISGHPKMRQLLKNFSQPIQCIYGLECTTYYGHVLCLNLETYVSWDNLDRRRPKPLFQAIQSQGALAGIAHPYSLGYPYARGCRFEMEIEDYGMVDFIEIFNNPEPLHQVNEKALLLWEGLALKGQGPAITCGMDLHGPWDMKGQFATFIQGNPGSDLGQELKDAIHGRKTWVSKGPILEARVDLESQSIQFSLVDTKKPGFPFLKASDYLVTLKTSHGTYTTSPAQAFPLSKLHGAPWAIPELYQKNLQLESLVCVSPTLSCLQHPHG